MQVKEKAEIKIGRHTVRTLDPEGQSGWMRQTDDGITDSFFKQGGES